MSMDAKKMQTVPGSAIALAPAALLSLLLAP
jgi:hypothetical protein